MEEGGRAPHPLLLAYYFRVSLLLVLTVVFAITAVRHGFIIILGIFLGRTLLLVLADVRLTVSLQDQGNTA